MADHSLSLADHPPASSRSDWVGWLYQTYAASLRTYLYYYVRDPILTDDLLSEAFERALQHSESYDESRGSPHAWLIGIGRNLIRMHFRRQRRIPWLPLDGYIERSLRQTSVEDHVLSRAAYAELMQVLQTLPLREQECLILKFIEGLTNREIAAILHLREAHIATIVYRALRSIRKMLHATGGPEQ